MFASKNSPYAVFDACVGYVCAELAVKLLTVTDGSRKMPDYTMPSTFRGLETRLLM